MDRTALSQLSPEELIAILEAQEARHRAERIEQEERHEAAMKAMLERIAELERRLGLNSGNSSKPPSSDGPGKPPRLSSLRERTGRKPGGQKGHPGKTLCRSATPDLVVDHYPTSCGACGAALGAETGHGYAARQVCDLPEPQPLVVTEHRAHDCHCPACGARTPAAFPDGVSAPVQYDQRIAASVVYLLHFQHAAECPFILPISGRSWKSIIRGIHAFDVRLLYAASREERTANSYRCGIRNALF